MDHRTEQPRLAVLIDAENAPSAVVQRILDEVAKYGVASVKRAYGDWTTTRLGGWKDVLNECAIQPIQQFGYTSKRNATDSALIIDAMDLLYTGRLQGFCIVSSDSDFTRLATRLRESGMVVYGFGEQKTPRPFVVACDKFLYTENFCGQEMAKLAEIPPSSPLKNSTKDLRAHADLVELLLTAADSAADEDGWTYVGKIGTEIVDRSPDFKPRAYGYSKLLPLIKATNLFEIQERPTKSGQRQQYLRAHRTKKLKAAASTSGNSGQAPSRNDAPAPRQLALIE